MKKIPEVGDVVEAREYAYSNKSGGTEIVNEKITCRISKAWHDYECGWRYHAIPMDKLDIPENKIYISQWDIITKCKICKELEPIMSNGTCLFCFNQGYCE